jgi:hypothetical protein
MSMTGACACFAALVGVGKRLGRDVIGRHLEGVPGPRAETQVERDRHGRAPGQGFKRLGIVGAALGERLASQMSLFTEQLEELSQSESAR